MDKEPRCIECAYAVGSDVASGIYVCRRYPKTETKVGDMWCGEWRDKEDGAVTDLRSPMYVVPGPDTVDPSLPTDSTYGATDYHYGKHTISGDAPKKKRGRPRKSGS